MGFDESQTLVETDVLRHGLVRVEPDGLEPAFAGDPLGKGYQRTPVPASVPIRMDGHIVEKHGAVVGQENEDSNNLILGDEHMDAPLRDESGIVVEHRSGLLPDERDVS